MGTKDQTRVTGYRFEGEFLESELEKILERGIQRGIVTQYDTGRGTFLWFNGHPGKELRQLRDECVARITNCRQVA